MKLTLRPGRSLSRSERQYASLVKRARRLYGEDAAAVLTYEEFAAKGRKALEIGICPYCKDILTVRNISPDHIHPMLFGGSSGIHNIEFICAECNLEKSYLPVDVYLESHPETRIHNRRRGMAKEYWADEIRSGSVKPVRRFPSLA